MLWQGTKRDEDRVNKMMTRAALGLALLGSLAACGSGGGLAYADLDEMGRDLETRFYGAEDTDTETMPMGGTATYQGISRFGPGAGVEIGGASGTAVQRMASEITLNVDFGRQTVSGELTNFRSAEAGAPPYQGQLDISRGEIESSGFEAMVSGDLESSDGFKTYLGSMTGSFIGDGAAGATGEIEGELTDIRTGGKSKMNGAFIAGQ
jgi:predicted small lipoprotein YifL